MAHYALANGLECFNLFREHLPLDAQRVALGAQRVPHGALRVPFGALRVQLGQLSFCLDVGLNIDKKARQCMNEEFATLHSSPIFIKIISGENVLDPQVHEFQQFHDVFVRCFELQLGNVFRLPLLQPFYPEYRIPHAKAVATEHAQVVSSFQLVLFRVHDYDIFLMHHQKSVHKRQHVVKEFGRKSRTFEVLEIEIGILHERLSINWIHFDLPFIHLYTYINK